MATGQTLKKATNTDPQPMGSLFVHVRMKGPYSDLVLSNPWSFIDLVSGEISVVFVCFCLISPIYNITISVLDMCLPAFVA